MSHLPRNTRSPGNWRRRRIRRRRAWGTPRRKNAPPARRSGPRGKSLLSKFLRFFFSRRVFGKLLLAGIVLALAGGVFLTVAIAAISRDLPEPGRVIERAVPVSTKIYDRTGETLLYDIHGEFKRTPVSLEQIAPNAISAALVAEDRGFYTHAGFDFKGILRSAYLNIVKGGPLRGGSTITQQLIKNAILTREKTLTRKLKELVLSYKIEKTFTKDEILNLYFNEIPYGSTIYGIEAAAQSFFQKSAADLDIIEGAVLAALPKAPTLLSPYGSHTEELSARVRHIINGMVEEGYLSKTDARPLLEKDPLAKVKPRREEIRAPHFVFYVREQLVGMFGEEFVKRGGLKVTTTLDWNLQQIAEDEIFKRGETNARQYNSSNAALVAEDVGSGQILAMVGSRDYFNDEIDGQVNVALRPRQPGSSFKPIVYAAAFAKGFTPDTPLWDVVTTFKAEPEDYEPHNYNDKEHGLVTLRKALAGSLNIPAVKTLYLAGIDRVLDLAANLGYTTLRERSRFGLSLVLGGGEVKLLEHINAFSTFARDGEYLPTSAILQIEDVSGRVLERVQTPRPRRVISSAVARDLTDILSDNVSRTFMFGAQNYLTLGDRPVAAKTGTTNNFRDGWTLGYTPSLAAGVWAGNNDNTEMSAKADGSQVAAPIWNAFMRRALENRPTEPFPAPEPRPVINPILRGQGMGSITLKIDKITNRLATEFTPLELTEERTYQQSHSLLYYLNKDNLSAPPPRQSSTDPNFTAWENAVRRYAEALNLRSEPPPTAYDDVHLPENLPSIAFTRPTETAVGNDNLAVELASSSRRGVLKVTVYLDGALKAEFSRPPYTFVIPSGDLSPGSHTLQAVAIDDVSNRSETNLRIVK